MPGKVPISRIPKDTLATHKLAGSTLVDGKRRTTLANPEIAKKVAKAQTTKAINRGWTVAGKPPIFSREEADNLKNGVSGMLTRISPDDPELKAKIESMDSDKLAQLYRNNRFVFEVYFDYGGIAPTGPGGSLVADPNKKKDAQFLIDEYERAFGAL